MEDRMVCRLGFRATRGGYKAIRSSLGLIAWWSSTHVGRWLLSFCCLRAPQAIDNPIESRMLNCVGSAPLHLRVRFESNQIARRTVPFFDGDRVFLRRSSVC